MDFPYLVENDSSIRSKYTMVMNLTIEYNHTLKSNNKIYFYLLCLYAQPAILIGGVQLPRLNLMIIYVSCLVHEIEPYNLILYE